MSTEPDQNRLEELANKYLKGTISPSEQHEFDEWFKNDSNTPIAVPSEIAESEEDHRKLILARIHENIGVSKPVRSLWPRIAAVASLLLFLSVGSYFLLHRGQSQQTAQIQKQDIAPGSNKAILTLANGHQIILTGAKNGLLANQGNATVNKTANGQIVYHASKAVVAGAIAYNTMTTPRGGQYHLTLADGTEVWLNAASSIKYPTAFTGKDRPVEITGEAYFEVAHNAAKPFRVMVKDQAIEVLGTHFNVNAYRDEPFLNTTLLAGKVKVSKQNNRVVYLFPGQQAVNSGQRLTVDNADTEQAVAWKNGFFQFDHADLYTVMRQLSRWYDVDVAYQGDIPKRIFSGKVHRNLNASESLQMLQYFKVNYQIQGKKITITP